MKYFHFFAMIFLSVAVISCGGGDKKSPFSGVNEGTLERNVTLPGFPHQTDFYIPSSADKAVVFLHGGGGLKYEFACNLGINLIDSPPIATRVDWDWLNANQLIAAFPQGQAVPGAPHAYTWDNHVTASGQDDAAFLETLASYIRSHFGVSRVYLAGHSSGGMMVNKMWCEAPDDFDAYVSISGPASSYYLSQSTSCSPEVVKPYYGIMGGEDNVLNVAGNWTNQTWTIIPQQQNSAVYVNTVLIGEWYQQITTRGPLMCNETPRLEDGVKMDTSEIWTNCDGRLELQEILAGSHSIDSLETASGQAVRDMVMSFIDQLQ